MSMPILNFYYLFAPPAILHILNIYCTVIETGTISKNKKSMLLLVLQEYGLDKIVSYFLTGDVSATTWPL
jgi:hypothetical protein